MANLWRNLLIINLLLFGCKEPTVQEIEQQKYARQEFISNYNLCRKLHDGIWYSEYHERKNYEPPIVYLKMEYSKNNCPMIIKRVCKRGTIKERC
jgi:hypothetical protein